MKRKKNATDDIHFYLYRSTKYQCNKANDADEQRTHTVLHIYCFIEEGEAAWYTKFCCCQMDNVFTTINDRLQTKLLNPA